METSLVFNVIWKQLTTNVQNTLTQMGIIVNREKLRLCKKARDLKCGDIVVPKGSLDLNDSQQVELLQKLQELVGSNDDCVSRISQDQYSLLAFFLNRPKLFRFVFQEVHKHGMHYGHTKEAAGNSIFVHCPMEKYPADEASLQDLRVHIVLSHIEKLLQAHSYQVLPEKTSVDDLSDLLQATQISISPERNSDSTPLQTSASLEEVYITKARTLTNFITSSQEMVSKDSLAHKAVEIESDTQKNLVTQGQCVGSEMMRNVAFDLQRIVHSKKLQTGKDGFDKNLTKVSVVEGDRPSDVLKEVVRLAEKFESQPGAGNLCGCLHVVPQHLAFHQQQVQLVVGVLSDQEIQQSQLVVGPVTYKSQEKGAAKTTSVTAHSFYRTRYQQMKEASDMRNMAGLSDKQGEDRQVKLLTTASIKLDVLCNAAHTELRLDTSSSDRGAESHAGAFILYNTARLATLMDHFSQGVNEGLYPPLPPVEDIDCGLLREEEEWELVYLYIAAFPDVLHQSVEAVFPPGGKNMARIHTHKVANFLVSFCKCLSAYYSRYHVLTTGEAHLLPLMYARLYLMKSAHQVLVNSLQLLGIESVSYL